MKRREAKSKGEKERYKYLNAEFQITKRDKKAFLSDQCKEIEENNRMGKTRDLFKKIRDTKGTFHANMGSIKHRNGRDLTEAEDIKNCHMTQKSHCWAYMQRKPEFERDTCTPLFITALFTIARTWKQPRCPLADEWIRKLWYIYTVEYYSATERIHLNQF